MPWITKALLVSVRKRNIIYKRFINSRCVDREFRYKLYRNKLTNLIKMARRNFYKRKFESAKNNLKLTWKVINYVVNKRKTKPRVPYASSFWLNGRTISDPMEIENTFFFSTRK